MKKTLLIICALLGTIDISAQKYWDGSRADHLITFGIRAGVNSSMQYALDDQADRGATLGYQFGASVDLNLVRSFSINSGVFFIQKGWKWDYEDSRGKQEVSDNARYLEIPLQASYRVKLSDMAQFQLNLGPYFAFGISGNQKVETSFPNGSDYEIDSFDDIEGGKKFDCGLSLGAAFTLSQFYVGINYERGLINVSNDDNKRFQSGCVQLSLGYNF